MPTFTQADTVAPGERTTADQMASLAAAANSRLLSGVGDGHWRIPYYLHSLWRQIRNPNDQFTSTPDGEFWNFYQHVEPGDGEWPMAGPGDPEGTNVSNILGAWVYGNDGLDTGSELSRLALIPVGINGVETLTAQHYWYLGQLQRGAHDPVSGATNWPVGDVAKAYAYIRQGLTSPHGNAYGGWLPGPDNAGGCADAAEWNPQIQFTNLDTGEVRSYGTNCTEDAGRVDVSYSPFAYYLFFATGAVEVLPKSEWIEGPYTSNANLSKTQSNALARVLNYYAGEFRGTEAQGAGETNIHAFDLQKFLTTQYPLAPNYGALIGDTVQPIYPSWTKIGNASAGTQVGGIANWPDGTVSTGFVIVSHGLRQTCTVELREGDDLLKTWVLPTGDHDELFWLPTARRLTRVRVVLRDALDVDLTLDPPAGLFVESNALIEYKPQIHDYYLVTRLSSFRGELNRIDGRGIDESLAKEIGRNLYNFGCVIPVVDTGDGLTPAGSDPTLNQNAFVDAARRWAKEYCRIIPRWNLTGYAVEGGKSVLWFNRTAFGPPHISARDMWDAIGPDKDPVESGTIKWGRVYRVDSGSVIYGQPDTLIEYHSGSQFTGLRGVTEFLGSGVVYEADGIKATAEPRDWSNRWIMSVNLKPYSNSNSSVWKPDAFADINTPFWSRCHFDSPEINLSNESERHVSFGEAPLIPEAPSGFNYMRIRDATGVTHLNRLDCGGDPVCEAERLAFYKSCRIYEPPVEIESTVMDGTELKVTLTGRLHYHEDAPSSIDRDPNTWNTTDLAAEDYRTHENGIREYIAKEALGIESQWKVGDNALNSTLQTDPDAPLGCCFPTFYLVKLIPEPYLDGNEVRNEHDSYRTHDPLKQTELYLRAMCEGFVDGTTTAETACEYFTTSAYDYTFENLMFQAASNRWVPLTNEDVRPDNPFGFGPLPNTRFYSETFNALANGFNLLTDARIMLPSELQERSKVGTATGSIAAKDQCGDDLPCDGTSSPWFAHAQGSLAAGFTTTGSWGPASVLGGNAGYLITGGGDSPTGRCDGASWLTEASITGVDVRWSPLDPDSLYALPGNLSSLLDTNSVVAMETATSTEVSALVYAGTPGDGTDAALTGLCGASYAWFTTTTTNTTNCSMGVGSIVPPSPPAGLIANAAFDQSGLPGTKSGAGGGSSIGATVYEDGTSIVRIPTTAYSGGS